MSPATENPQPEIHTLRPSLPANLRHPRTPASRLVIALVSALLLALLFSGNATTPTFAAGTSYYVDCSGGNDLNTGTASSAAWKTLNKANAAPLSPGDRLLLKRDCTWSGSLVISRSGTASAPVEVGAYGSGGLPTIQNTASVAEQTLVIVTGSYVTVTDVATRATPVRTEAGCQNAPVGNRLGFYLHTGVHHVTLQRISATGHNRALLIMPGAHHNRVLESQFVNNRMLGTLTPTSVNAGDDDGPAAITIMGNDNELADNTISGTAGCSYDFGTTGTAVLLYGGQRNTVRHTTAAENVLFAYASGAGATENILAYNQVTSALPTAGFLTTAGITGNTGAAVGIRGYNNTVYLTGAQSNGAVCTSVCSGNVLALVNNIIWAEDLIGYSDAPFTERNNLFWRASGAPRIAFAGSGSGSGISPSSRVADPQFVNRTAGDLQLKATSPATNAGSGETVAAGFVADLAGKTVPFGGTVDLGAYESDVTGSPPIPAAQRTVSLSVTPQTSPPNEGGVIESFDVAHAAGMRGNFLSWTWAELEPSAGVYNLSDAGGALQYLGGTLGLDHLVTLKVVDTTVRGMPADLASAPFDSAAMRTRFRSLIDALLPQLVAGRVQYLSLGNEVDRYLALNPAEAAAYRTFYADAVAYLHQVAPSIKVGVTLTFDGASASAVAPLLAASDAAIFTYYPVGEDFVPRPPTAPRTDFPRMTALAAGRPVVLQEAGYPSSPVLTSSDQAQADFVSNLYAAWNSAGTDVPFVNVFAMHDLSTEVCASLEQYYSIELGPNFTPYLCSLGLRRADGTAKAAWHAFASGATALASSP